MNNVIVVIGAGLIGQAIARRISAEKHVLLTDLRQDDGNMAAAKVRLKRLARSSSVRPCHFG